MHNNQVTTPSIPSSDHQHIKITHIYAPHANMTIQQQRYGSNSKQDDEQSAHMTNKISKQVKTHRFTWETPCGEKTHGRQRTRTPLWRWRVQEVGANRCGETPDPQITLSNIWIWCLSNSTLLSLSLALSSLVFPNELVVLDKLPTENRAAYGLHLLGLVWPFCRITHANPKVVGHNRPSCEIGAPHPKGWLELPTT
jgi:hypothetical protein